MSAFMHTLVARFRAMPHSTKTSNGGSHDRDVRRAPDAPPAARPRKWIIAGLR
jgi:hypothetical protein